MIDEIVQLLLDISLCVIIKYIRYGIFVYKFLALQWSSNQAG